MNLVTEIRHWPVPKLTMAESVLTWWCSSAGHRRHNCTGKTLCEQLGNSPGATTRVSRTATSWAKGHFSQDQGQPLNGSKRFAPSMSWLNLCIPPPFMILMFLGMIQKSTQKSAYQSSSWQRGGSLHLKDHPVAEHSWSRIYPTTPVFPQLPTISRHAPCWGSMQVG